MSFLWVQGTGRRERERKEQGNCLEKKRGEEEEEDDGKQPKGRVWGWS